MTIAFCADIHIGAPNTNLSELMDCFERMISSSDLVVIGGDILDAKYHASSDNITVLLDLMDYITSIIGNKPLRLIYGTQSHDGYPQLQILNPYTKRMNFKIISHVTEEFINKRSVLYIPEEIIASKSEYYADTLFSGKKYDYIFGHGVIAEGMPMVRESKVKRIRSVPVFKTEELRNACKRQCCFGHYHRHTTMADNVAYVGSITRFKHGEPEMKGWFLIRDNDIEFVENPWTPKYYEVKLNCTDYTIEDFQTLITEKISEFALECGERDKIKFTCFIDRHAENATSYTEIIRTLCKGPGISYVIKDTNEIVAQDDPISDQYDYILDPNVPIRDKIVRYNSTEFDGELDTQLLTHYLQKAKAE